MPVTLPPADTNVVLPPSVQRAAAASEAAHAAAYPQPQPDPAAAPAENTPQPDPANPNPQPQPDAKAPAQELAPVQPQPQAPNEPAREQKPDPAVTDDQWQHRYYSMEGRYRQAVQNSGLMQQQLQDMGDELLKLQELVTQLRSGTAPAPAHSQQPVTRLTQADRETYGDELLDVVKRAAREAVEPDLQTLQSQNRQNTERVAQSANQTVFSALDSAVPDWRKINVDPRFKAWCRSQDVYSGQVRGRLLHTAFKAADAPRVAEFFKGFQREEVATGNAPSPQPQPQNTPAPRQAATTLEALASPGRAKPASGSSPVAADKPVFTRAQVKQFYENVRAGRYSGRDADKLKDEQAIFAAQNDGRIR